ncbi:MAG: GNAT family N-acetyltransferase [Hahellaceae bacterium]|nr:GNAT family N-acetyltransferase [Hahellaceae bacterium]
MSTTEQKLSGFNSLALDWLRTPSFQLVEMQEEALERVLLWRNSPEIRLQMVDDQPISMASHLAWFEKQKRCDKQIHFVVKHQKAPVGISNLRCLGDGTLAEATELEVGLYYGDAKLRGSLLAFAPALMTINFCFKGLGAKRLFARVKASNLSALRFNKTLGYEIVKNGPLIQMDLTECRFDEASRPLCRLLKV